MINDTITAIATPTAPGAIGVVRVSGGNTAAVLQRIFTPKGRQCNQTPLRSHRIYYGHIKDNAHIIDEVMCAFFASPRSYTTEDMAEIYCHGGAATLSAVLCAVLANGTRPAEPGEFTKRAFLNGRIDLSQAEAVMDLIHAKTDMARRTGLRKLSGGLSRTLQGFRTQILTWLAHIELSVDYPEHQEEAMNLSRVAEEGGPLRAQLAQLLATARHGQHLQTGIPTAILGRPNVGKSSLMNALLQDERAIVTEVPGTTRDTLTETLMLGAVPLRLTDTAGVRDTSEVPEGDAGRIEQMGIARSREQARRAEVALLVVDRTLPLPAHTAAELAAALFPEGQDAPPHLFVLCNKADQPPSPGFDIQTLADVLPTPVTFIDVSAKTGVGLDVLERHISQLFLGGALSPDGDVITRARHEHLLAKALAHLQAALDAIQNQLPEDLVAIDLSAAYAALGEILGEAVGDDILDRIFAEFCVGK